MLRSSGLEVVECHVSLWHGVEDRVKAATGSWASPSFAWRIVSTYLNLLKRFLSLNKDFDAIILGYPGQLDAFLARILAWIWRKPLVLDMFMSIYLIALERGLNAKSSLSITLIRLLERFACRLPDLLICDTPAYRAWHCKTHRLYPNKFRLVATGADDRFFKPVELSPQTDGKFRILYYGTYIPNHGIETMITAANLLKTYPEIYFEFVGRGPNRNQAIDLANHHALSNVTFTDWIDKEELPHKIASADLLLGVFGTTPQSVMTVQNKIYEALSMGKPIISGESSTVREVLTHSIHAYLVERTNPKALAEGILTLYNSPNLRESLGKQGRILFEKKYSIPILGKQFKKHLLELIK